MNNLRERFNHIIVYVLVAALLYVLVSSAAGAQAGLVSTFVLNPGGDTQAIPVPDLVLPSVMAWYVYALVAAYVGGWQVMRLAKRFNLALVGVALLVAVSGIAWFSSGGSSSLAMGLVVMVLVTLAGVAGVVSAQRDIKIGPALMVLSVLAVFAFIAWSARDKSLNLTGLLSSSLLRAVPIAMAGLSGVLCERCAVINIGIEGMMLTGAFFSALLGSLAKNIWGWGEWPSMLVGLLGAVVVGALLGLLLAVLAVRFKIDQIIAGTAITILSIGITSFLSASILAEFQELNTPDIFPRIPIPGLASIPVIGPVFFEQNPLVYLLFVLLILSHVMLFYTRWGLRTRAVGEHPRAADTLGVNVFKNRYINVMVGGIVGALGGAFLILGSVGHFDELMTAGKGYIGLAAMIFGKWMPFGVFGAALIFGFADALQTKLAILQVPIPSQFLLMTPYLVTIIVLAGVVGEAQPPAADGQPYEKQ
jgi:simple sugar transport system permease protein